MLNCTEEIIDCVEKILQEGNPEKWRNLQKNISNFFSPRASV